MEEENEERWWPKQQGRGCQGRLEKWVKKPEVSIKQHIY